MTAESREVVSRTGEAVRTIIEAHYEPEPTASAMAHLFGGLTKEGAIVASVALGAIITGLIKALYGVPAGAGIGLITLSADEDGELTDLSPEDVAALSPGARAGLTAGRVIAALGRDDIESAGALIEAAADEGPEALGAVHVQFLQVLHGAEHSSGVAASGVLPDWT